MVKTILCPVDFSAHSIEASEFAALIASHTGRKLLLLNKFLVTSEIEDFENIEDENLFYKAQIEANSKLEDLKKSLLNKGRSHGLDIETISVYGIDIDDVVLQTAEEKKVDMIVMGTGGAESAMELIFGTNSLEVINKAPIPVIVVPKGSKIEFPEKIIYATDLLDEDHEIIMNVIKLANDLNSKLIFLHVTKFEKDRNLNRVKETMLNLLDASEAKGKVGNLSFDEVVNVDVFEGIQEYSRSNNANLIVLGNHQKNFFEKLMTGDFTRLMTLYSQIPLLVLQKKK